MRWARAFVGLGSNAADAGGLVMREKLPTPEGTSFPRPNQFHAHGYVNEMNDAVDCALEGGRYPQSGPMLAWDTMAVLMSGYESSEKDARFVDLAEYTQGREFPEETWPNPAAFGDVLPRQ